MPTSYAKLTEIRAIEEFRKKIEKEEGVKSIVRPEPPDVVIQTLTNRIIWAEVASIFRTRELAEFLNKHGLNKPGGSDQQFSEHFDSYSSYISQIRDGIIEISRKKDSKDSYIPIFEKYGKGNLILYVDDPFFGPQDFENLSRLPFSFEVPFNKFSPVYLFIPETHSLGAYMKKIGGLYPLHIRT